jgi:hypothetical protein
MMQLSICAAVRHATGLTLLLLTVSLFCVAGLTCAAAVGDQVELKATHPAGVPFHHAPGGTQTFQRVPGGTVATVMGTARDGRWLQLRLPDQRTGWITERGCHWPYRERLRREPAPGPIRVGQDPHWCGLPSRVGTF